MIILVSSHPPKTDRLSIPEGFTLSAVELVTREEADRRRAAGAKVPAIVPGYHVLCERSPK